MLWEEPLELGQCCAPHLCLSWSVLNAGDGLTTVAGGGGERGISALHDKNKQEHVLDAWDELPTGGGGESRAYQH